jgi:hypothetical protein
MRTFSPTPRQGSDGILYRDTLRGGMVAVSGFSVLSAEGGAVVEWPENWQDVADAVHEEDLDPWGELTAEEARWLRESLEDPADPPAGS